MQISVFLRLGSGRLKMDATVYDISLGNDENILRSYCDDSILCEYINCTEFHILNKNLISHFTFYPISMSMT